MPMMIDCIAIFVVRKHRSTILLVVGACGEPFVFCHKNWGEVGRHLSRRSRIGDAYESSASSALTCDRNSRDGVLQTGDVVSPNIQDGVSCMRGLYHRNTFRITGGEGVVWRPLASDVDGAQQV